MSGLRKRREAARQEKKEDVEARPGKLEDRFAALERSMVDPKSGVHVDGLLVRTPVDHSLCRRVTKTLRSGQVYMYMCLFWSGLSGVGRSFSWPLSVRPVSTLKVQVKAHSLSMA